MSYEDERDREQLRNLAQDFDRFVQNYRKGRPTLILLPGGLGSNLARATQAFQQGPPKEFDYETIWLAPEIMWEADCLEMSVDIDSADRFIISDGPVSLLGVNPYGRFEEWCETNRYNYFVLGWDWRRRISATARFLSRQFLPALRQRVLQACGEDPLNDFTLIGHSFGGLVLKLFLSEGGSFVQQMARAVTVGTPFYGSGGQIHRIFSGQDYLNDIYGRATMAKIVASLRGGYVLFFTDHATYQRDKDELKADPDYPLLDYPSTDFDSGEPADPYKPSTKNGMVRYPTDGWFFMDELPRANGVRHQITEPLPRDVNAKFYNFRGAQTDNGGVFEGTVIAQTWSWVKPGFDPETDPSPIIDKNGKGDDTIPAWSARLVSTLPDHVRTFTGDQDDLQHMFLMEHDGVLEALRWLIGDDVSAKPPPRSKRGRADPTELRDFLGGLDFMLPIRFFCAGQAGRERLARRFLSDALRPPTFKDRRAPKPLRSMRLLWKIKRISPWASRR